MKQPDLSDSILFCGAFLPEIQHLQKQHPDLHFLQTGIGNTESAISLLYYLVHNPHIHSVVFTGSAGFYREGYQIGQIVSSSHFVSSEIAELHHLCKTPALMKKEIIATKPGHISRFLKNNKIVQGITNSINSVTTISLPENASGDILLDQAEFENMEVFGMAMACEKLNKEFIAVFSLTNRVWENGSKEWQQNHQQCSIEVQSLLARFILWLQEGTES